jgi:hypothetical protein
MSKSDAVRLRCEREALVSLAGVEAQRKFNPRSVRKHHGQHDFHSAVLLMGYFFESPVLEPSLEFLPVRVQSLFENHPYAWRGVAAVATALLERESSSAVLSLRT